MNTFVLLGPKYMSVACDFREIYSQNQAILIQCFVDHLEVLVAPGNAGIKGLFVNFFSEIHTYSQCAVQAARVP